ncbi:MAG: hypothetical protein COB36_01625 [Alphaproteobacteria bacterium]|nr:MAG: hypothetical protein COB36_01625 [Alphaproteobacteria bacterium]
MIRLASILFVILILPLNVMAAEISDQGAQKLKTSFEDILAYQKEVNEAFGSVRVIYEGELTVKQESEYYTITLPRILLKNPEITPAQYNEKTKTKDQTFDMGVISINAMPDDKAGYWKMVWALPESMTMSSETEEDFTISFGSQNVIALFDDTLGYFTKLNMNLSDVHFKIGEQDTGTSIGNLQLYTNLDRGETGTFSGPGHFLISNLFIVKPEDGISIKTEELKISSTVTDLVLPTLLEYKAKLLKHAGVFDSLENIDNESDAKDIDSQSVLDMMLDMYDIQMSSINVKYNLKNIEIISTAEAEAKNEDDDLKSVKIGSAFIEFGSDNINTENGTLHIKMGHDALDIQSDNPLMLSAFLPTHTNLDVRAENIPYSTLSKMIKNSAAALVENPSSAVMVGFTTLMKLPAILSQANTQLIVKDNIIKNNVYDISLNGKVITDITAVMGFSAKFKTVFKGLDDLLSKVPRDPENEEAVNTIKQLEKLKSLGKVSTDENGKTVYTFDFEANPQGSFTLNGQDTSTIDFD